VGYAGALLWFGEASNHCIASPKFFSSFEQEDEFLLLFILSDRSGLNHFVKVDLPFGLGFFLNGL